MLNFKPIVPCISTYMYCPPFSNYHDYHIWYFKDLGSNSRVEKLCNPKPRAIPGLQAISTKLGFFLTQKPSKRYHVWLCNLNRCHFVWAIVAPTRKKEAGASKWEFNFHFSWPFCHTFASLFLTWLLNSLVSLDSARWYGDLWRLTLNLRHLMPTRGQHCLYIFYTTIPPGGTQAL